MEATDESTGAALDASAAEPNRDLSPEISAHSANERRTVFTESDNSDGWIATDLTVDVRE